MKKIFHDIVDFITSFLETSKPLVIILILGVVIMGVANGYKYYQFTEKSPKFCELCHLMKEPYTAWQKSRHSDITCQTCHSMSLISKNGLLIKYLISGNKAESPQKHGSIVPWNHCRECHLDEASQGAVTMRKSYGHARHVFMEKIDCKECHSASKHNFPPDERNCLSCHQDKGVHGLGMESFACLTCHVYGETTAMPKKERCIKCHKNIPKKAPMSTVDCRNCHKPHSKIRPTSDDCLSNCHINQSNIGRHDRHMKVPCLECHKAHKWHVGEELSLSLCSRCHEYKDPLSFIF